MIEIDGSKYEGGGAVLRTATALATIAQQACHVFNIRKNRDQPGLRPQHLSGLRALNDLCNGILEGDQINSEEITFQPGQIRSKTISIDIKTAGSITLALQGLIPVALQAPQPLEIHFKGGATDTFFSPTLDYFQHVFLKTLEKMGASIEVDVEKRGYYPEGGAKVEVKIQPSQLDSIYLKNRGQLKEILISSGASTKLEEKQVADRQLRGAKKIIPDQLPLQSQTEYYETDCPGSHICLVAQFENTIMGTDNIGKLGKKAEQVGKEAALELIDQQKTEACVDKHLADQILIHMALAEDQSVIKTSEITDHCETNIWIIEKFLKGEFETKGNRIKWVPA